MAVDTIEVTNGPDDELAVTVKLKGKPDAVVKALCHGLPREALMQMQDALGAELAKRRDERAVSKDAAPAEP